MDDKSLLEYFVTADKLAISVIIEVDLYVAGL